MMKALIQSQWKKVDSFHFVLEFSQTCHSISGLTALPQTRKQRARSIQRAVARAAGGAALVQPARPRSNGRKFKLDLGHS